MVVAVLGPVEVHGAARSFERAWTLDLVAYLAMHRRGASSETWVTALWPDRLPAAPTLHSTASAARRALGPSADGPDHLPRSHGHLRLGPTVGTDWERFRRLARSDRPDAWVEALDLVRGRPLGGLRSPDWAVLEGFVAEIEEAVVDIGLRLAGHLLERYDARTAGSVARRALLVSPFDERLYRVLLQAADAQGNPAGVESVMAELTRLVGGGAEATGARSFPATQACELVHPDTAALYRALSRRLPAVGRSLARL